MLPLLGVQVQDGSNYKCCYEIADKGALPCAYPTSNGGEMRLLVVQEVSHVPDNRDCHSPSENQNFPEMVW